MHLVPVFLNSRHWTGLADKQSKCAPILPGQQPRQVDVAYADVAALRQHAVHVQVQGMQIARRVLQRCKSAQKSGCLAFSDCLCLHLHKAALSTHSETRVATPVLHHACWIMHSKTPELFVLDNRMAIRGLHPGSDPAVLHNHPWAAFLASACCLKQAVCAQEQQRGCSHTALKSWTARKC